MPLAYVKMQPDCPVPVEATSTTSIANLLNDSCDSTASTSRRSRCTSEIAILQDCVRRLLPELNLTTVAALHPLAGDIHLNYSVRLSDGTNLILKSGPDRSTRIMRKDHHRLESESRALVDIHRHTCLPVPRCVKYTSRSLSAGLPPTHLVRSCIQGTPLSKLRPNLSHSNHERIDRILGTYFLIMSSLTARSFGTPHDVHIGRGCRNWREAFLAMLEATLRDAEDMLVSIPYDAIRYHISAREAALDDVTTPRLTAFEACLPHKVLMDEETLRITGLLGFGDVVWGDPEMAAVLVDPSDAFLETAGRTRLGHNESSIKTRRLIYAVYRSLVAVVKHHYRPRLGEDDMVPRRALACDLNELAKI